jgi:hypothetical protein
MSYERMLVAFVGFIAVLLDSVVVAEFAGHWLRAFCTAANSPSVSATDWMRPNFFRCAAAAQPSFVNRILGWRDERL